MLGQTNMPGVALAEMSDRYGTLLMNGIAVAPLSARNGDCICSRNGQPIEAWGRLDAHRQEAEDNAVSRAVKAMSGILDDFSAAAMKGTFSTALSASNGDSILSQAGQEIRAWTAHAPQPQESAADIAAEMFALLSAVIDGYRLECAARIQDLEATIMSGRLTLPLSGQNGAGINTRSGVGIDASKYIN